MPLHAPESARERCDAEHATGHGGEGEGIRARDAPEAGFQESRKSDGSGQPGSPGCGQDERDSAEDRHEYGAEPLAGQGDTQLHRATEIRLPGDRNGKVEAALERQAADSGHRIRGTCRRAYLFDDPLLEMPERSDVS